MVVLSIPVSISISTLVVELVLFLVMVWAMETFVFTPIRRAWADRDRHIQEGLEASTESREEIARARGDVQRILNEARLQAQSEIDAAVARGGQLRDELVGNATAEFRRLLEGAQGEIGQERERTANALQGRIVDLALLAAAKVTGQSYHAPQVRELAAAVVSREGLG